MKILEIEFIDKTGNFAWTKIKYKTFFGKEKESYLVTQFFGKAACGTIFWPSGKSIPYNLEKVVVSFIERALNKK